MNTTQYTLQLAHFAASTTSETIPDSLFLLLPVFILDLISALLCGLVQPTYTLSLKAITTIHGTGGSHPLLALDGSSSSLAGVMYLNGIAAGNYQFEHVIRHAHPASSVLPALFTVASTFNTSGSDLLTAMAVGYEISSRIGLASGKKVETERGFHNPGINGQLAVAAAIGNLLDWDAETIASAMGVAASSSAGLVAFQTTDAMTKQIQPGHGGALGAEAAFLASAGIRGPTDILENPKGFLHAFSPKPNLTALTAGLGENWISEDQIVKLFPMHSTFQVLVSAVTEYRKRHSWDPSDIESVTVYGGPRVMSPSHHIPRPETVDHALYSTPFCIAMAVVLDLADPLLVNDTLVHNREVLRISEIIEFIQVIEDTETLVGDVAVRLKDQTVHTISAPYDSYAGYRSHPGFVEAIEMKYHSVIARLGIDNEGSALQRAVNSIAESNNVRDIYDKVVAAGSAAMQNSV
ncbi:hypothetical protein BJY04DRAFT_219663 [Aspergillus karnatakaensis]|uniref:MmgE/PrpD family protein n=1 Tax=Aspergillus karnatakaensis TaxID=1810916 RepID=UPI003CCE3C4E